MKKLLVLMMIVTMTLTSLVGCGKESSTTTGNTFETITVGGNEISGEVTSESETAETTETAETAETKPAEDVVKQEKPEPTEAEKESIVAILDEAFEDEESYKYAMNISISYPLNADELGLTNSEFKAMFGDNGLITVVSNTETTVDNMHGASFTDGKITSTILGTTSETPIKYYVVEEEDNYTSYLHDSVTDTWSYTTSFVEYTDIYNYYKKSDDFYITNETKEECTIEGIIYYIDLAYNIGNVAGDIGIEYDTEIPVKYIIDKTDNRVKSITFGLENVNNSLAAAGTEIDITVELLSVDAFTVEVPADIIEKAVNWGDLGGYPEDVSDTDIIDIVIPQ